MSIDPKDQAGGGSGHDLESQLRRIAAAPVLLVACDFDGVLSPIANRPRLARPDPDAIGALSDLAATAHTHGAIISGRALADLRDRLGTELSPRIHVVGSHGLETDLSLGEGLPAASRELLKDLRAGLEEIAARVPGIEIEPKTVSLTMHYRNAEPAAAERAVAEATRLVEHRPAVYVISALAAVEFLVVQPDKGRALAALRRRCGAGAVVFLGDDATDERAFATLTLEDVGIRIGDGETAARWRLASQRDVGRYLGLLVAERRRWIESRGLVPIERHALLSDQRTIAIIDPAGRLSWMCAPRIDSPAIFASLLGDERAGVFEIAPEQATAPPEQDYVPDSFLLRTRWPGITLTDYFDGSQGRPYQRAGRCELIRVVEGEGSVKLTFAPRLDFGRVPTRIVPRPDGLLVEGWHEPIVLAAPGVAWSIEYEGEHQTARARVDLSGRPLVVELRYGTATLEKSVLEEHARREQTRRFWSSWAASLTVPGVHEALVRRSALVLKALCHGPSGAIAAAATTSLPEHMGGVRNWDYRYCWPRDASLAAASLVRLGNTGIAMKLLDWLAAVVQRCDSPESLRPLYTVDGADCPSEAEIGGLSGYGDSRPVRIGNLAAHQVQLDVFGPIVHLVAMLAERGAPVTPEHWRLVEAMVRAVEARWREPDHGIWEVRGPKRHHVHSKVMCWHAVDRAITVARLGMGVVRPAWSSLREEISADVLAGGWNARAGAFTGVYGEPALDAASLAIGLTGLIRVDDPRWVQTVEAVEHGLCEGGFVHRYRGDDSLPGVEGAWFICTSWLIEALATLGRRDRAMHLLDGMASCAGPLGLFSEEIDPESRVSLGNFPQAYSHLGMINAALCLAPG